MQLNESYTGTKKFIEHENKVIDIIQMACLDNAKKNLIQHSDFIVPYDYTIAQFSNIIK